MSSPKEVVGSDSITNGKTKSSTKVVIPCECNNCSSQYRTQRMESGHDRRPYLGTYTDEEAASIIEESSSEVMSKYEILRELMSQHGRSLQRRWMKLSLVKRKALLLKVDPNIFPHKYITIQVSLDRYENILDQKYINVHLLPYLNLENLSVDSNKILQLIYYRTIYDPEEWTSFDNQQLLPAWQWGVFGERFANGSVILQGKDFGTWQPFNRDDVHNGKSWAFPRASLILNAQSALLQFLLEFAGNMLEGNGVVSCLENRHGYQFTSGVNPSPAIELQPSKADHQESGISFSNAYSKAPFSAPPRLDLQALDRLVEIAENRTAEIYDHIMLLQYDPSYFHEYISYWTENSTCDVFGMKHNEEARRKSKIECTIFGPVFWLQNWQHIVEELSNVRREYLYHGRGIHIGQALPERFDQALSSLMVLLWSALQWRSHDIAQLVYTAPAFKDRWESIGDWDCIGSFQLKRGNNTMSKLVKEEPIFYWLTYFAEMERSRAFSQIPKLLSFLDDHLATSSRVEGSKLDQITYDWVSNLGTMHSIFETIQTSLPAVNFNFTADDAAAHRMTPMWESWAHGAQIDAALHKIHYGSMDGLIDNLAKFCMPTGKKNADWLTRVEMARAHVSRVWKVYKFKLLSVYESCGVDASILAEMTTWMSYDQTEEYKNNVAREKSQIMDAIDRQAAKAAAKVAALSQEVVTGFSSLPHGNNAPYTEQTPPSTPRKRKVKTRGISISGMEELTVQPPPPPPAKPFYVLRKNKYMKTISLLFPLATEDLLGHISWDDFKATLVDIGFSAEHRGGSEWTFRTRTFRADAGLVGAGDEGQEEAYDKDNKSITIHQPHPGPKLYAIPLQRMGRRFARRFGWARECFHDQEQTEGAGGNVAVKGIEDKGKGKQRAEF